MLSATNLSAEAKWACQTAAGACTSAVAGKLAAEAATDAVLDHGDRLVRLEALLTVRLDSLDPKPK